MAPPGNQGRFKQDQQVPRFLHLAEQLKLPELKKKVWDMKAQENQYFQSEEKSCKGVVYVVDALISSTKNAFKVNQNNSPKFWVGGRVGRVTCVW